MPTAGGAMVALAMAQGRIDLKLMRQALDSTLKPSCFVMFILIGSTCFSLPGGRLGFLIFALAFFLDFFKLSFIIVPLLGPVPTRSSSRWRTLVRPTARCVAWMEEPAKP